MFVTMFWPVGLCQACVSCCTEWRLWRDCCLLLGWDNLHLGPFRKQRQVQIWRKCLRILCRRVAKQYSLQFCISDIGQHTKQSITQSSLLIPSVGLFGFAAAHNKPSFIYTTFSNKIYVYHCISLTSIPPSNLLLTYKNRVRIQYS